MILTLNACRHRHFDRTPLCSHPDNAGKPITLLDCRDCPLIGIALAPAETPSPEEAGRCISLGKHLGDTACQCGTDGLKTVEVFVCGAGHGRDIKLPDGGAANACQLDNHQKMLAGRWPLPLLPSCSTCQFRQ